jgi:hypothetical protein
MEMIEKVVNRKRVKEICFDVCLCDKDTFDAVRELIAHVPYEPSLTVKISYGRYGFANVEVSNIDDAIVHDVIVARWQSRFLGDEWGERVLERTTVTTFRIGEDFFIAYDGKLRTANEKELKEKGLHPCVVLYE